MIIPSTADVAILAFDLLWADLHGVFNADDVLVVCKLRIPTMKRDIVYEPIPLTCQHAMKDIIRRISTLQIFTQNKNN